MELRFRAIRDVDLVHRSDDLCASDKALTRRGVKSTRSISATAPTFSNRLYHENKIRLSFQRTMMLPFSLKLCKIHRCDGHDGSSQCFRASSRQVMPLSASFISTSETINSDAAAATCGIIISPYDCTVKPKAWGNLNCMIHPSLASESTLKVS